MTWWKIHFDEGLSGHGWLKFNEFMEAICIYDADGNVVDVPVGYTPFEFNTEPEWL